MRLIFLLLIAVPLQAQVMFTYGAAPEAAAPAGCTSAPTYVGYATSHTDSADVAGNVAQTFSPPDSANMKTGDLVIINANYRNTAISIGMSATGGQAWTSEAKGSGTLQSTAIMWCTFNGVWSGQPSIINAGGGVLALSGQMHVFRPCDTTHIWVQDVAQVTTTFTAPADSLVTITGVTTTRDNAVIFASWNSQDDDAWTLETAGWTVTGRADGLQNMSGSDQAQFCAYQIKASAGASGNVAAHQRNRATDAGQQSIIAFWDSTLVTAPATPVAVSPIDNSLGGGVFVWNKTVGALSYEVQVDTDNVFTAPIFSDVSYIGDTTTTVANVGGSAYWRVRAKNGLGYGSWSSVGQFIGMYQKVDSLNHVSHGAYSEGNYIHVADVVVGILTSGQRVDGGLLFYPNIPQGSTIDSAFLNVWVVDNANSTIDSLRVFVSNSDSVKAFIDGGSGTDYRPIRTWLSPLCADSVDWIVSGGLSSYSILYISPDIKTQIQTVVNRAGWAPGKSIGVMVMSTDTGAQFYPVFGRVFPKAAYLRLRYH